MKGFKTKQQMTEGHYCWGGKVMKKAEGGSIRSQFNDAFGEARKRGDKTFEFRGKMYGTELAKPKPKVDVGPHGPGDESFTPDKAGSRMKNVAEENDYRSGSTSQPEFVRKQYSMPGVRMGKAGEPAIVIGGGEDESPKPVKSNYNYGVSRTKAEQDLADIVQKKRGGAIMKKAKGGYAEGGMRSERTEVAKASREVQDNAMAPARQLNKSLKNLYNTRKQTGYESDPEGFAMGGMRKMRSDKGFTKKVEPPKQYPSGGPKLPGMIGQNSNAGPDLDNATPPSPLALQGIARKKGGKI